MTRFVGSATAPFESNAWSLDLTVVPTTNRRVHGYYADVRDHRAEPLLQGNTIPGFGDIRQRHRQVFTLNDVSVLRPTLVNEARLGFLRGVGVATPAQLLNPTDLGMRVGNDDAVGLPQISVGGGLNFGGPAHTLIGRQGTTFVSPTRSAISGTRTHCEWAATTVGTTARGTRGILGGSDSHQHQPADRRNASLAAHGCQNRARFCQARRSPTSRRSEARVVRPTAPSGFRCEGVCPLPCNCWPLTHRTSTDSIAGMRHSRP